MIAVIMKSTYTIHGVVRRFIDGKLFLVQKQHIHITNETEQNKQTK